MVVSLQTTLYDIVKENHDEFVASVAFAVHIVLAEMGQDVFKLDWANQSVSVIGQLKQAA